MTYTELVAMLEPIGVTVVPPGQPGMALPQIALEPTAISLLPGVRVGWEECNIVVRYPLNSNDPETFDRLNETAYDVIGTIVGTQVQIEDTVELLGEPDAGQPAAKYVIACRFPGRDICPTPAPSEE